MRSIVTNPANKKFIDQAFPERSTGGPFLFSVGSGPFGVKIRYDAMIPERKIEERWHPPDDDAFVKYEESDHVWLKALGGGRIEYVDMGPLFYEIDESFLIRANFGPSVNVRRDLILSTYS